MPSEYPTPPLLDHVNQPAVVLAPKKGQVAQNGAAKAQGIQLSVPKSWTGESAPQTKEGEWKWQELADGAWMGIRTDGAQVEELAGSILDSSTYYSIVALDSDFNILSWNEGARHNYGYSRDEILGKSAKILHHKDDVQSGAVTKLFERVKRDAPSIAVMPRIRKDGTGFTAQIVVSGRYDETGQLTGYIIISSDITATQSAADEAAAYARSLLEASLDPLVTISPEGKITDVNKATEAVTGRARDELLGTDFSDYFTEPEKALEGYQLVFEKGKVTDYPLAIRNTNGDVRYVLYNASVYRESNGQVKGVFAAARDITDRRHAESQQRLASAYARSLIEASLDPLVTISPEGKITDVNEATELATGVPRQLLIGTDFSDYFTEPRRAREGYQLVFEQRQVRDYPLAIRHKSGNVMNVLYNASVYKDEDGNVQGVFAAARDISEQKKAQELQRTASEYARSLIEASLDPLVTISSEGKITDVNQATENATGRSREELIGTDFSDYFTEPDKAREGYETAFSEGQVRDYPLAIRHRDAGVTYVLYNASVYKDEAGNVQGVFAAARDITGQHKAQEAQRQTAAYARSLIEASLDPLVTINARGQITDVNEATELATGVPRQLLVGTDFSEYFTEPGKAREGYQTVFSQGKVRDYPLAIRHKTGRIIDVTYNASVYKDEEGNVRGVFAAARDMSEQKKAEQLQQAASAYARSLIEASVDPLVTISQEGKITDVNEATEKVTGRTRNELIGTDFSDYFTEPDQARSGYKKVFEEGQVTDYPLAIRHKDSTITDVLYNASVYKDEGGKVQGVFAAARDITERKKAEELVQEASAYSRSLLEASLDPLVTISPEGKITDVNEATEKVTGRSRKELIGTDFSDYFTEPDQARSGYKKVFEEGQVTDYPLAIRHKDSLVTDVLYNASVYRNEAGKVQGVFAAARDITAQKDAEEKLRDYAESLQVAMQQAEDANRAKSEFLANMSHEIRTPLNAILGMMNLLSNTELQSIQSEYLRTMQGSGQHLQTIINDILDLSKIEAGRLDLEEVPFSYLTIVEDAVEVVAREAYNKGLELTLDVDDDVPKVFTGDPFRMRQVILNLTNNAVKFTAKGHVSVHSELEGDKLHLVVSDTGIGIDSATLKNLFQPFTQGDSSNTRLHGGTGLGLAICHRIVDMMGGEIWATSEVGKGSQFHVRLPLQASDEPPVEGTVFEPGGALKGANVVLVEDSKANTKVIESLLNRWGATCKSYGTVSPRIAQGDAPSVIILDGNIKGKTSLDAGKLMHKEWGDKTPPILVYSSTEQDSFAELEALVPLVGRLAKPVRPGQLYNGLDSLLRGLKPEYEHTEVRSQQIDEEHAKNYPADILVVEDMQMNLEVMVGTLAKMGYKVDVAGDGKQAVDRAQAKQYNLILMDIQMPVMDGYEAVAQIRKDLGVECPYIVATTAHAGVEERNKAREAGFDDYLTKPIQAQDIAFVIRAALAETPQKLDRGATGAGSKLQDLQAGMDRTTIAELRDAFMHDLDRIEQQMENATTNSEIRHALHSLISIANYVGHVQLSQAIEDMRSKMIADSDAEVDLRAIRAMMEDVRTLVNQT